MTHEMKFPLATFRELDLPNLLIDSGLMLTLATVKIVQFVSNI